MNPLIQLKKTTSVFLLTLLCFVLLPTTQAVFPAPDGAYPGGNTAEGQAALFSLTTGGYNTAVGFLSLRSDSTNSFNTAVGAGTLLANTGDQNTATGAGALLSNGTGGFNTANGAFALFSNTVGASNNAFGDHALFANTTGFINVAIGSSALAGNISGNNNIGIGFFGGSSITTANNVIAIGAAGISSAFGEVDNACYIGGIYGQAVDAGTYYLVAVDADGKLGTFLVDANGNKATVPSPSSLQQQAMLNRKVEEQEATIAELKSTVAQQQKQIEALTTGLQKVSAQLEASKPAPQVVNNP